MRDIIVKAVSFIQVKLGEIVSESQWYQGLNKHFDNISKKILTLNQHICIN